VPLVIRQFNHVDLFPHRRLLRDAVCVHQNASGVKTTVAED